MVPALAADLTLVCDPNTNKGLVEGVFLCGFVFILDLGVSSLRKGVSPHSPQPYPDPT